MKQKHVFPLLKETPKKPEKPLNNLLFPSSQREAIPWLKQISDLEAFNTVAHGFAKKGQALCREEQWKKSFSFA